MHFHEFLFQGFPVLQLEDQGEEGGSRFSKVASPVQRWRGRVAGPPQSLIIRMVGIIVTWWPLWRQVTLPPQPAATTCDITIVGFGEEGEQEVSIVTTIIVTNGDSPFHTSDMWCWVYTVQPTWVFQTIVNVTLIKGEPCWSHLWRCYHLLGPIQYVVLDE